MTSGAFGLHAGAVVLLLLASHGVSSQNSETSILNQRLSVSNREDTLNIGNQHTNNYIVNKSSYKPSQKLVLKLPKITRRSRPPTRKEFAIKQRLLETYNTVVSEVHKRINGDKSNLIHLEHLGRILLALNPKYIATERVRRVAFADPADPNITVVPPETLTDETEGLEKPQAATSQITRLADASDRESIMEQIDLLSDRFEKSVIWSKSFAQKLLKISDRKVSPRQLVFKRLIQCLSYPKLCNKPVGNNGPQAEVNAGEPLVGRPKVGGSGSSESMEDRLHQHQPQWRPQQWYSQPTLQVPNELRHLNAAGAILNQPNNLWLSGHGPAPSGYYSTVGMQPMFVRPTLRHTHGDLAQRLLQKYGDRIMLKSKSKI